MPHRALGSLLLLVTLAAALAIGASPAVADRRCGSVMVFGTRTEIRVLRATSCATVRAVARRLDAGAAAARLAAAGRAAWLARATATADGGSASRVGAADAETCADARMPFSGCSDPLEPGYQPGRQIPPSSL